MIRERVNDAVLRSFVKAANGNGVKHLFLLSTTVAVTGFMAVSVFAGETKFTPQGNIFEQALKLMNEMVKQIRTLSHVAAFIGVASGAFMKKFSLGKMDRIETGNKIMVNTIWGWILINTLTYILGFLQTYTDLGNGGGQADQAQGQN